MKIKTEGVVIREKTIGEQDRLLFILTKDLGVISAFARNAKKLNNRLASSTQLFSYSSFVLFKGKNSYSVNEATSIELFFEVKNQLNLLALASYFCELMMLFSPKEEEAADFLRLLLICLYYLHKGNKALPMVKAAFELKLLSISGFFPNVNACIQCGKNESRFFFFQTQEGCLLCEDCITSEDKRFLLNVSAISAIRFMLYAPFEKMFSFITDDDALRLVSKMCEEFMIASTEYPLKTLRFYHEVADL